MRRRELDGTWTSPFLVPSAYLADSAELDYAGNTHVGQGRTVDTAHLLVTGTLSRRSLYVGLTRGRDSNTAHIVTGTPRHPATRPTSRPPPKRWSRPSWTGTTRTCPPRSRSATPRTGPAEPVTCSPCGPYPPLSPNRPLAHPDRLNRVTRVNLHAPVRKLRPIMNRTAERHDSTSYSPTLARLPSMSPRKPPGVKPRPSMPSASSGKLRPSPNSPCGLKHLTRPRSSYESRCGDARDHRLC